MQNESRGHGLIWPSQTAGKCAGEVLESREVERRLEYQTEQLDVLIHPTVQKIWRRN